MNHENIPEGELVLLVTAHQKTDVLTLGVSRGLESHPGFTRKIMHRYLSLEPVIRLAKGKVVVEGKEYPVANWLQSFQTFNLERTRTRSYVGKEKIVEFLKTLEEYSSQVEWVNALELPYGERMPRVKQIAYIDIRGKKE